MKIKSLKTEYSKYEVEEVNVVTTLTWNDEELYHLRSLCGVVYQETGVWHELHDDNQIMRLLRYSCVAPVELIYGYFCRFISVLDIEKYEYLRSIHVLMPDDFLGDCPSPSPSLYAV